MFRFFETAIDPFRDHDDSMPPASLMGYYGRYCRQVWPFLVALLAIGLIIALIEVTIVRFVGALVDILRATPPDQVIAAHGAAFLGMALLILVGRPMASFAHDLVVQQAIAPGMTNLIRWQTHRYVLRQSVAYFANDFAGRIASNIVQAAASLRELGGASHRRALVRHRLRLQFARHFCWHGLATCVPVGPLDCVLYRNAGHVRSTNSGVDRKIWPTCERQ